MEDNQIVDLFWQRNEKAIEEASNKYGSYLHSIAYGILSNDEDAKECVNDTYIDAWNAMPPHKPSILSTFLGKITRRISIDLWRKNTAKKRGGGEISLVFDELEECVSGSGSIEEEMERKELSQKISMFLKKLPVTERKIFLCRYWYLESVKTIAERFGFTESKVTSMLYRLRGKLRKLLEKEGYLNESK